MPSRRGRQGQDRVAKSALPDPTRRRSTLRSAARPKRSHSGPGELDVLVNNAGAIPGGDLLKVDEETWRRAWELKVFGYINLTRLVYAGMKQRKRGVIVNIIGSAGESSTAAYIAAAPATPV
jgi:NADP-dependent 3-hydroxy acid dehydrogenase YdfG